MHGSRRGSTHVASRKDSLRQGKAEVQKNSGRGWQAANGRAALTTGEGKAVPYPLVFRPNAVVNLYDAGGAAQATDLPAQVFKPLVGTKENDFTRAAPWGSIPMAMRVVLRVVVQWGGVIPTGPSGDVGGSWLLRTTSGGAPYQTFLITGGFRWDDSTYWLLCAQL